MRPSVALLAVAFAVAPAGADDDFEKNVRPLLVEHCSKCHGPKKQSGGLRLDSKGAILLGGDNGPAAVSGKPDESRLVRALAHKGDLRMPPDGKLPDAHIAKLKEWIRRGLPGIATNPPADASTVNSGITVEQRKWWSFQPLRAVIPPTVPADGWSKSEIDRFISARLRAKGLTPAAPADKRTLLRRATYDLTGLPPSSAEVDSFLKDDKPDAFARVIERLLASPAYGERWGRHWLDVVRYADTAGENSDHPVPDAWRYRNWVIDAFNKDRPYDEFVREQIAGDILAAKGPEEQHAPRVIATGFLAIARRFDNDPDTAMHLTFEDTIDTVGKAFLGLSISCARCHDHKYDPITNKDYYALYGILQSTKFTFPGCEPKQQPRDRVPLLSPASLTRRTERQAKEVADLAAEAKRLADAKSAFAIEPKVLAALAHREAEIAKQRGELTRVDTAYAVSEGKIGNAKLHLRGDPEKLGVEVPRRWLELLGGQTVPMDGGSGRLQLAGWLTDPANPLTARVMANRVWQYHFGKGLVKTPNDYGTRGSPPTHPELLDWLAAQFVKGGWSVKALHRRIMLSATYQQAVEVRPDAAKLDPINDLYWRFDRRPLSAEELRDSLLTVSGQLDCTPGGAHPFPPESTWTFTQHIPFSTIYETDKRSVYLTTLRNRRNPFFALFDGADPNSTTPQRQVTTVPTQALFFMNDPFFHAQAEKVAGALLSKPDGTRRLDELYRLVFQRLPTAKERETAVAFQSNYTSHLTDVAPVGRPKASWAALTRILLASNDFLYVE